MLPLCWESHKHKLRIP